MTTIETQISSVRLEQVDLPGGRVTLEPLDALIRDQKALEAEATASRASAQQLLAEADDHYAAAGAILGPRRSEWPSADSGALLAQLDDLVARIDSVDGKTASLSAPKHGFGAAIGLVTRPFERHELETERSSLATRLRGVLVEIARAAPPTTVPAADAEIARAREAAAKAEQATQASQSTELWARSLADEVGRRQAAMHELKFDSLYTAGWLLAKGPAEVESPLILKRAERAYVSVPARLARRATRTTYVGGSQGFSFPIGHTGIRYRVGSFRGHPIQQGYLADIDTGTVVLTNQRWAFVGSLKTVTLPLQKVVHVEAYSDALAVFREGRENADYYRLTAPQYVLFYLNYLLGTTGTAS